MNNSNFFKTNLVHSPSNTALRHWIYIQMLGWYRCVYETPEYYNDGVPGYDFIYTVDGNGWADIGGKRIIIPSSTLTLINTGDGFGMGACKKSTWEFLYVHFNWNEFENIYQSVISSNGYIYKPLVPTSIAEDFWTIYNLKKNDDVRFELVAFQKILNMITNIYYHNTSTTTIQSGRPVIEEVYQYIRNNYQNSICLNELSNLAGYSKDYLSRLFKRETGYSLMEFVIKCRLEAAKEMLLNSSSTINEIALNAGFNSPSYFNRLFKSKVGITPADYRKRKLF